MMCCVDCRSLCNVYFFFHKNNKKLKIPYSIVPLLILGFDWLELQENRS